VYVIDLLRDYKRGALGPVGQLDAPLVDYLRAAETGYIKWSDETDHETDGAEV
jgi:hypothetical protein